MHVTTCNNHVHCHMLAHDKFYFRQQSQIPLNSHLGLGCSQALNVVYLGGWRVVLYHELHRVGRPVGLPEEVPLRLRCRSGGRGREGRCGPDLKVLRKSVSWIARPFNTVTATSQATKPQQLSILLFLNFSNFMSFKSCLKFSNLVAFHVHRLVIVNFFNLNSGIFFFGKESKSIRIYCVQVWNSRNAGHLGFEVL